MPELTPLAQALSDLKEDDLKALVKQALDADTPAMEIMEQCHHGMAAVGQRYEKGEYFISELMYAGEVMKDIMADLEPLLNQDQPTSRGATAVVIGTVQRDIHDIGKDVVALMLRGAGFDVIDIGVDAPPAKFVDAIQQNDAKIVGMSVFLTMAYESITKTVAAIEQAGLREQVSVMVGGGPVTELVRDRTGCDFYGKDAVAAVNYALEVAGAN